MTSAEVQPRNPARIESWPLTLPLEIALRIKTAPEIFKEYGYDRVEYRRLCADPAFREAVLKCAEQLASGGGQLSFKLKAQLMADHLLDKAFDLTNQDYDIVPPAVQADMVKSVIKFAGLDGSRDDRGSVGSGNLLQIQINL